MIFGGKIDRATELVAYAPQLRAFNPSEAALQKGAFYRERYGPEIGQGEELTPGEQSAWLDFRIRMADDVLPLDQRIQLAVSTVAGFYGATPEDWGGPGE